MSETKIVSRLLKAVAVIQIVAVLWITLGIVQPALSKVSETFKGSAVLLYVILPIFMSVVIGLVLWGFGIIVGYYSTEQGPAENWRSKLGLTKPTQGWSREE